MFGIGVSPGTGNEVHFVLRVTERVSISKSPTLRITHDGVRSCCVYMCIHFISSRAIRLLGHHASICVIGGTRIEARLYLWKYIAMPLSYSLLQQNEESVTFRSLARFPRITAKQRLIGASRWISAQGSPDMHHYQKQGSPWLACQFYSFLS